MKKFLFLLFPVFCKAQGTAGGVVYPVLIDSSFIPKIVINKPDTSERGFLLCTFIGDKKQTMKMIGAKKVINKKETYYIYWDSKKRIIGIKPLSFSN